MEITFDTYKREDWLKIIAYYADQMDLYDKSDEIVLCFPGLKVNGLLPLHVVSLACLIQKFYLEKFYSLSLDKTEVGLYLFRTLRFQEYWAREKHHVSLLDPKIFNLWHITDEYKEFYGRDVAKYLKRLFWKNKDLSSVEESITEACYNTLDHSYANGNAFSFIKYDENEHFLSVAVCDFGIGIARSVQSKLPDYDDEKALRKAIEVNFTVGSKSWNGGMGLDVIRNSVTNESKFTIISNNAFLMTYEDNVRTQKLDFEFKGTLIDFRINLSQYADADDELIDEITF